MNAERLCYKFQQSQFLTLIHSSNKYLLSTYCVPIVVLVIVDKTMSKNRTRHFTDNTKITDQKGKAIKKLASKHNTTTVPKVMPRHRTKEVGNPFLEADDI